MAEPSECTRHTPREWYEICTIEGHPFVIDGPNFFLSREIAEEMAATVCTQFRGTVTVVHHAATLVKVLRPVVTVETTEDVAS